MYVRSFWWLLVAACLLVFGFQLWAATVYALDRNYEALAFIALFGLWAMAIALPCAAISMWRWRSLSQLQKWIGAGLPAAVFVLAALAFILAA
jgi:hypothetical protein